MHIHDAVYGSTKITEPLLIELIQSKPMQRMKGVMQNGAHPLVNPSITVTRYEHGAGVMILLQKYGASREEQVAGLLHDVGHTVFSHVIDVVFREFNDNYDDAHLPHVIEKSEIPAIMKKYGMDWKTIVEKERFSLLEKPLPKLCADRIDYTLRDGLLETGTTTNAYFLENLTTHNGEFAFANVKAAQLFSEHYQKLNKALWTNPRCAASFEIMAKALREALDKKVITEEMLYLTDKEVFEILKKSDNPIIQKNVSLLNYQLQIEVNSENPDFAHRLKNRWIDPLIWDGKEAHYLSEVDPHAREKFGIYRENKHYLMPLKIIPH
jgi:HD superfamily phosphohydrolase